MTSQNPPPMPRLSVAIVTHNEETNLPRTLGSVRWADEIVVVDSGSTDRTAEIARACGARVIERPWPGFAAQKNFALAQCGGPWLLSLDADEELSPELGQEIKTLLATNPHGHAYRIQRRNLFLGRWIRYGGFYPDAKLRLFRRDETDTQGQPRFENRPVHETIPSHGAVKTLQSDLIHHAYPTLEGYLEHMNRYSTLSAELRVGKGAHPGSWLRFVVGILVAPLCNFLWNYLFRRGFLDGREGLLLHLYQAVYSSWKYAKAWERSRGTGTKP